MRNSYYEENLGKTITFNQKDIPSGYKLDSWDTISETYDKNKLLICIGDSWTWGDSLTPMLADHHLSNPILTEIYHDYEKRKELLYGAHLSKILNADWKNYGMPGYSNLYILERFAMCLNDQSNDRYDDIYYVLCLTETGREHKWLNQEQIKTYQRYNTIEELCSTTEQYVVNKILELYGNRDLSKLIICRNFTVSYDSTDYHTKHLKSWIEINYENDDVNIDLDKILATGPVSGIGINPVTMLDIESYEDFMSRNVEKINSVYSFLEQSKLHSKKGTKHPTAKSHLLWAEYLAQNI